jgi:hypothetical protein
MSDLISKKTGVSMGLLLGFAGIMLTVLLAFGAGYFDMKSENSVLRTEIELLKQEQGHISEKVTRIDTRTERIERMLLGYDFTQELTLSLNE